MVNQDTNFLEKLGIKSFNKMQIEAQQAIHFSTVNFKYKRCTMFSYITNKRALPSNRASMEKNEYRIQSKYLLWRS
jgi:uncharacterized protein YgbK (DUF1537 family)